MMREVGMGSSSRMIDTAAQIIHTGPNGRLASTTSTQVEAIADQVARADRAVLHFHGGLVSEEAGFEIAGRLHPIYAQTGALPVFFVWSSGFLETITGNLQEIFVEDIFQQML